MLEEIAEGEEEAGEVVGADEAVGVADEEQEEEETGDATEEGDPPPPLPAPLTPLPPAQALVVLGMAADSLRFLFCGKIYKFKFK